MCLEINEAASSRKSSQPMNEKKIRVTSAIQNKRKNCRRNLYRKQKRQAEGKKRVNWCNWIRR